MLPEDRSFAVIVLAAQRKGQANALAQASGVSHKCLVPIGGLPLIRHVVGSIAGMAGLERIRISIEEEAFPGVRAVLTDIADCEIEFIPAASNLADSVHAASQGLEHTIVITTADHVLLLSKSVEALLQALSRESDAAIAFARRDDVLAAHPEGQRRFYRFSDGSYSNCNLYGLAGQRGRMAVEIFRSGGQFAKNPGRIASTFGVFNLLLMRLGWVSLATGLKRVSRRIGIRIVPVVLDDGTQAIDVDNERTYGIVEQLLARRLGKSA